MKTPFTEFLGRRLTEIMAEQGLSDAEACRRAEALGLALHPPDISRTRRNARRSMPGVRFLLTLSAVLDVSLPELLADADLAKVIAAWRKGGRPEVMRLFAEQLADESLNESNP